MIFSLALLSIYTSCKLADFKISLNCGIESITNSYNNYKGICFWLLSQQDSLKSCLVRLLSRRVLDIKVYSRVFLH